MCESIEEKKFKKATELEMGVGGERKGGSPRGGGGD